MASLFDPSSLGMTSPQKCSCQELLSLFSPSQHGWLRRRCKRNKLHTKLKVFDWPQFYVIVNDKCLYYYKNETSKKPSGAVSLYGYNRVCRSNEIKSSEAPWCFKVEHIQPEMRSFYFSVSSERDMVKWMRAIKDEMLKANNISKRNLDTLTSLDESSCGSSDYSSLEEVIFGGGTSHSRVSIFSEDSFDGGNSSDSESGKHQSWVPVLPPIRGRDQGKKQEEKRKSGISYKHKTDYDEPEPEPDDYWAAVHFSGSKFEASEVISGIAFNGVYLVRKSDDGLNVLQVYIDDSAIPRKYKIYVTADGKHTLSEKAGPYFDTLEEMLFHYYSTKLPHTEHHLTVPYKLHPDFQEK